MRRSILASLLVAATFSCTTNQPIAQDSDLTRYVDPRIGSSGHGHVFVGANTPFGAVQLGTVNITEGWDWCSGYHYSDTTVIGFAHTHLSGTGIGDKGDLLLMPVTGDPRLKKQSYLSPYSHANEIAQAGYYNVLLDKYNIQAELTATTRAGVHRYSYPQGKTPKIIINLRNGIGWDAPKECLIRQVNDTTIEGYRLSTGWAVDDRVYFTIQFSERITSFALHADTTIIPAKAATGKAREVIVPDCMALVSFTNTPANQITARVAISGVDIEGSAANLSAETDGKSFDQIRSQAKDEWNNLLQAIQVESSDTSKLRSFYTALYHASFFPAQFSDVNGNYRGADGNKYNDNSFRPHTIFSLWDTYRAAHPLFTIITPERVPDFVNSFIKIYEQQGKVPVWHLAGNETDCMVGFGSVQVIADAIVKGFGGFDHQKAYQAIKAYSTLDERGLKSVREKGFIPADQEGEAVAKAMEYCISDYGIAQAAKKLGYTDDYNHFMERSRYYKRYFDSSDNFIKGVMADGSFRKPFDPVKSAHRADDFCEGNAWQYLWMVPHDFEGLFAMFPSPEAAESKLDSTFIVEFIVDSTTSPDISGLIGQYAQGNEPNHSTIYAYTYLGKQWKTAQLARRIMDTFFSDKPDGLCGNEDCGQMSAWYVFNAMGFYPANPVGGEMIFGSPLMDKATIRLANGKSFTMVAENNSPQNIYIESVILNGKPYAKNSISYDDIMAGGELRFKMSDKAKM